MHEPNALELQAVVYATDLASEILALKGLINDPTLGVEIEPLKIYCQKTGHIIGARDENSLFSLIKFKGKSAIVSTLYNAVTLSVHPAWVETGYAAKVANSNERHIILDTLMEQDPIGYACYCFGLITAQFYQNAKNMDRKRQPWVERYWAMARANALLTQRGIGELTELNIELCRLLTYAPDTMSLLFKRARALAHTPDMLAMLACTGELTPLLKKCTNQTLDAIGSTERWVKATRFVDFANTPADAARGPSNIRKQRASKRDVEDAGIFAELMSGFDKIVPGFKFSIYQNTPGTSQWRAKFESNSKAKAAELEAEMLSDYAAIGGSNFDFVLSDDDENDETVEVRTLAIEPSHASIEAPQAPIAITNATTNDPAMQHAMAEIKNEIAFQMGETPQKPLTALERLRARQKGN